MTHLGVGLALHADAGFLQLCRALIEDEAEFFEVMPEGLWRRDDAGAIVSSSWTDVFEEIQERSRRPFVAHGIGLSIGTAGDTDEPRYREWLAQLERDCRRFNYLWYTEHLGWMTAGDREMMLPLPLPPTEEAVATVARRLAPLKALFPHVGFENQTGYFNHADARSEAPFWNRLCHAGDLWLLLDLHNAWAQCRNARLDLDEYLTALDLSRVLEIHLSGGSDSDPAWLASGQVFRLDSHDGPVPEPVWQAFAKLRPRCPNLRGVVVERLDGTIAPQDVGLLAEEVRRAKAIFWEH